MNENPVGIFKVQLFRHQINNACRVIGWKLNDNQVNFTNKEEAEQFAAPILEALENLNQIYLQTQQIIAQQHQIDMQHGNYPAEYQQQQPPQQQQVQPPAQIQPPQPPQMPPSSTTNNYQTQISGNTSMHEYALPQKQMQQMNIDSLNNFGDNYAYGATSNSNCNMVNEYRGTQVEEMSIIIPNLIATTAKKAKEIVKPVVSDNEAKKRRKLSNRDPHYVFPNQEKSCSNCHQPVPTTEFTKHFENCPLCSMKCRFCNVIFTNGEEYSNHNCVKRKLGTLIEKYDTRKSNFKKVSCIKCHQKIRISDMKSHLSSH